MRQRREQSLPELFPGATACLVDFRESCSSSCVLLASQRWCAGACGECPLCLSPALLTQRCRPAGPWWRAVGHGHTLSGLCLLFSPSASSHRWDEHSVSLQFQNVRGSHGLEPASVISAFLPTSFLKYWDIELCLTKIYCLWVPLTLVYNSLISKGAALAMNPTSMYSFFAKASKYYYCY